MIKICACYCGSSDSLVRSFLKKNNYLDWATIPIVKGKDKCRSMISTYLGIPEMQMLDNFLKDASKWAVIIGIDGTSCRWADIAHGGPKAAIDAGFIIDEFA